MPPPARISSGTCLLRFYSTHRTIMPIVRPGQESGPQTGNAPERKRPNRLHVPSLQTEPDFQMLTKTTRPDRESRMQAVRKLSAIRSEAFLLSRTGPQTRFTTERWAPERFFDNADRDPATQDNRNTPDRNRLAQTASHTDRQLELRTAGQSEKRHPTNAPRDRRRIAASTGLRDTDRE